MVCMLYVTRVNSSGVLVLLELIIAVARGVLGSASLVLCALCCVFCAVACSLEVVFARRVWNYFDRSPRPRDSFSPGLKYT